MFKKEKKIPNILGLVIILSGLVSLIAIGTKSQNPSIKAVSSLVPQEVKITNLSDTGFTVSFLTQDKVSGFLAFGKTPSLGQTAFDDRDEGGKPKNYLTHHLTLSGLVASSVYYFKIVSGGKNFDNNGSYYMVALGPAISSLPPKVEPAYGTVLGKNDVPAEGSIVYLSLGEALPLSTLVKPSGNWLISLSQARTADLKNYFLPAPEETEEILVQGEGETASVRTSIKNDSPVPTIVLGKSYDFQKTQGQNPEGLTQGKFSPAVLGEVKIGKVEITAPQEGSSLAFPKPLFKGTAVPGKEIEITIESFPQTGRVKVSPSGSWSFTPQKELSSGEHTVTISTEEENGKPISLKRKFFILASGSQVLGVATPSATLTPPTPTPTLTLTPSPTARAATPQPTATSSGLPKPGNLWPTFFLLGTGALFLFSGVFGLNLYGKF